MARPLRVPAVRHTVVVHAVGASAAARWRGSERERPRLSAKFAVDLDILVRVEGVVHVILVGIVGCSCQCRASGSGCGWLLRAGGHGQAGRSWSRSGRCRPAGRLDVTASMITRGAEMYSRWDGAAATAARLHRCFRLLVLERCRWSEVALGTGGNVFKAGWQVHVLILGALMALLRGEEAGQGK